MFGNNTIVKRAPRQASATKDIAVAGFKNEKNDKVAETSIDAPKPVVAPMAVKVEMTMGLSEDPEAPVELKSSQANQSVELMDISRMLSSVHRNGSMALPLVENDEMI
jgi:hypothetical protein